MMLYRNVGGAKPQAARSAVIVRCLVTAMAALLAVAAGAQEIRLPEPDRAEPIVIAAEAANRWTQGQYEVWLLRGQCRIGQGAGLARSDEAVLWIDRAEVTERRPSKIIAYLQGNVEVQLDVRRDTGRLIDRSWLGRFYTSAGIQIHVARVAGKPDPMPPIFQRGTERRDPPPAKATRQTQFTASAGQPMIHHQQRVNRPQTIDDQTMVEGTTLPPGTRRIRFDPRSNVRFNGQFFPDLQGNQSIAVIDSGVTMTIKGLGMTAPGLGTIDMIDVSTDRLVVWTQGNIDLTGHTVQDQSVPMEIYMEGNIVFREGERVIYAKRMYYDVTNQTGVIIDAEIRVPVSSYQGLMRLRADLIRQTGPNHFFAQNGYFTSSRMGRPGYRIQASGIYYEDIQRPKFELFSGRPAIDPATHEQMIDHQQWITARNNFLFLGRVPVFYWPILSFDANDPTFYIRGMGIKSDQVYGTQILTTWDGYELLGVRDPPDGTDWDVSFDYLGERGFGHGTTFAYNRPETFALPGPAVGLIDYWGISDGGVDILGRGRAGLVPEEDYRFRLFGKHRQKLSGDWQLTAEIGWISDRNFLEAYYEREWDELKDETTGLELKRTYDNVSYGATADLRLNDFFTQTEWLPRGDHFWLGQPLTGNALPGNTLTWYEHSSVGYAQLRPAERPSNPLDTPWDPLPWERSPRSGERLVTRQEIDWPVQLGAVKLVPYALGELGHWGEALDGDDLQRSYYQAGLRASLPMWRADPMIESRLLNVHGLAHKVVFDAEFSVAEANHEVAELPLYDPLDDDSIEAFRRRLARLDFGGPPPVPRRFDERFYALRTGLGGWVTSPSTEVAGDMTALRMGMRHRWQTKRGMPGRRRILDWIVLDANATLFPKQDRDNFGESLGLLDYAFRWHVGDRLTFVSDGLFDFFRDGQQIVTLGGFLARPPRGSLYLGLRILEGPVQNHVFSFSYSYQMSPKWLSSFGTSVDFGDDGNIGQRFTITRIGESLLLSAGFTVDAIRDNVGVQFAVEPRFLPRNRLGGAGGGRVPLAGMFGLK